MAILWSRQHEGVQYEVRAAGNTIRLYTDGVFHSSYNPSRPVTGGVWDLMMMPAFFYPVGRIQRVLLLGVGGGTVIRQLREFVRPLEIVAVELNDIHLQIAREHFGAEGPDTQLIHADARDWLRTDRSRYDLVIDDLFGGRDGEPERAVEADADWCRRLAARTARKGAVAINCLSPAELNRTGFVTDAKLRDRFRGRLQLRAERDQNAVGIFLPKTREPAELRRNLAAVPRLNPKRETRLAFSVHTLK